MHKLFLTLVSCAIFATGAVALEFQPEPLLTPVAQTKGTEGVVAPGAGQVLDPGGGGIPAALSTDDCRKLGCTLSDDKSCPAVVGPSFKLRGMRCKCFGDGTNKGVCVNESSRN